MLVGAERRTGARPPPAREFARAAPVLQGMRNDALAECLVLRGCTVQVDIQPARRAASGDDAGRGLAPPLLRGLAAAIIALLLVCLAPAVAQASSVGATSLSISSPAAGATEVAYTVGFTPSSSGALATMSTITIAAPTGTVIPDQYAEVYDVGTNQYLGTTSYPAFSNGTATATYTVQQSIPAGHQIRLTIGGVTNPGAASYRLEVSTSSDATPVASPTYSLSAPQPVTAPTVALSTTAADATTVNYAVEFTTSPAGGLAGFDPYSYYVSDLSGDNGSITVAGPAGTVFPTESVDVFDLTANVDLGQASPTFSIAGATGTWQLSTAVAAGHRLRVTIAGVTNAPAGSDQLAITTSSDTQPAQTGTYMLTAAQAPGSPSVALSSLAAGAANVTYTLGFTASLTGGLASGASITLTAPLGTVLPDQDVEVVDLTTGRPLGTTSVTVSTAGNVATWQLAESLPAGHAASVAIPGVTNPSAGSARLALTTSSDTATASTSTYALVAAHGPGSPSVDVSSPAAGATGVTYTLGLTASATGALAGFNPYDYNYYQYGYSDSGTITLVGAAGTVFPAESVDVFDVTANQDLGSAAYATSLSGGATGTWELAATAPAGHRLRVTIPGVTNGSAGSAPVTVTTSSDSSASQAALTLTATRAPGSPSVALSSLAAGATNVTYTVGLAASASGALTSAGSITVAGPPGTVFAGRSADVFDVTANRDLGYYSAAASSNGGATTTVQLSSAGVVAGGDQLRLTIPDVTNPPSGMYDVGVSTSSDTVAANTATYSLVAAQAPGTPSAALSSAAAGATNVTYTVGLSASTSGALASGASISVAGPAGTVFAGQYVDVFDVTANKDLWYSAASSSNNGATTTVTLSSSVAVTAGDRLRLTIPGVTNPASGSYQIGVSTSSDLVVANSPKYSVVAGQAPASPSVALSSPAAGAPNVTYTVGLTVSATGALAGYSYGYAGYAESGTITLAAPAGTAFPAEDVDVFDVTANQDLGTAIYTTSVNNGATRTWELASAAPAGHRLRVTIPGVTNAPAGSDQLAISTSSDTVAAQAPLTLTAPRAPAAPAVELSTMAAGATNVTYTVGLVASASGALASGGSITLTGPAGTVFPGQAVDVFDVTASKDLGSFASSSSNHGATTTVALSGAGASAPAGDQLRLTVPGVTNPATGAYQLGVSTSSDSVLADTATYSVVAAQAPASPTVSVSSSAAGTTNVTYTVGLTTSSSGALAGYNPYYSYNYYYGYGYGDSGTITLVAPAGTVLPNENVDVFDVTANQDLGSAMYSTSLSGGASGTWELATAAPASHRLRITIPGVTNAPQGTDELAISTSSDTVAAQAPLTLTAARAPGSPSVGLSSPAANATNVTYTVGLTTSAGGGWAGGGSITVAGPAGTVFPNESVDVFDVTANTDLGAFSAASSAGGATTTVTLSGESVAGGHQLRLSIPGVTNAGVGATSLAVSTSSDTVAGTVPYTLFAAQPVGSPAVLLSSYSPADTNVTYTVGFTASATGALAAGVATITVTAPAGTTIPAESIDVYDATTNEDLGYTTYGTQPDGSASETWSLSPPVPAGHRLQLTIAGVTNPAAGDYPLSVSTSSDSVASTATYAIGGTPLPPPATPTVALSTPAAGATGVAYTVGLSTSASGALTAGSDSITVTGPAGTVIPDQAIDVFDVSAGVDLGNTQPPTLSNGDATATWIMNSNVPAGHLLRLHIADVSNPGAGTYQLAVGTSVDGPRQTTKYTVSVAQAPASASATLSSRAAGASDVTYTTTFTTSPTGALTPAGGSFTVAAPPGTVFPNQNVDVFDVTTNTDLGNTTGVTLGDGAATATWVLNAYVPAGDLLRVAIAGVTNAPAGTEPLAITTSSDVLAAHAPLTLTASQAPSAASVAVTSPAASAASVTYTVGLTTSVTGALANGATVTLVGSAGTVFPNEGVDVFDVTANEDLGVAAYSASSSGGATATWQLAGAVAAGDRLRVTVPGVTNGSAGSDPVAISTSSDSVVAQAPLTLVAARAPGSPSVALSSLAAGATNVTYTVGLAASASGALVGGGSIVVVGPAGTVFPNEQVDVFDVTANSDLGWFSASSSGATTTVALSAGVVVAGGDRLRLTIAGVTNPGSGGYQVGVSTSSDSVVANTAAYSVVAAQAPSAVSVALSSLAAGATNVTYTVGLTASSSGGLAGPTPNATNYYSGANVDAGTVTLVGSAGTVFPNEGVDVFDVTANEDLGVAAYSASSSGGATATWQLAGAVAAGDRLRVTVPGVTNGSAGSDPVAISTSSDSVVAQAPLTLVAARAPGSPSVALSSLAAGATNVTYTVGLAASASGALVGGGSIVVVGPAGTVFPNEQVDVFDVTANSDLGWFSASSSGATTTVALSAGVVVAGGDRLRLTIAGVTNPGSGGYQVGVSTSSDSVVANTAAYSVVAAQAPSAVSVALSSLAAGATNVTYTVGLTASSSGGLAGPTPNATNYYSGANVDAGTVTLVGSAGTVFPNEGVDVFDVTANEDLGVAAYSASSSGGATATWQLAGAVAAGDRLRVTVPGVTNGSAGSDPVAISTSSDSVVAQAPLTLVAARAPGSPSVALSSLAAGATNVTYTVGLAASASGALVGGGSIVVVGPAGTVFPNEQVDVFDVTANSDLGWFSASSSGATTTVALSAGVVVAGGDRLRLTIAGVTNPGSGGYQVGVSTSSDSVVANTAAYSVVAAQAPSAVSVALSSLAAGATNVTYTVGLTASSSGGLAAPTPNAIYNYYYGYGYSNAGTITLVGSAGTVFPVKSVDVFDVTANEDLGVAAYSASSSGGATATWQLAGAVAAGDRLRVTVPGVTNGPMGTDPLAISTSSDTVVAQAPLTLAAPQVAESPSVAMTSNAANAANVTYVVGFASSSTGDLEPGGSALSSITVAAPAGTALPDSRVDVFDVTANQDLGASGYPTLSAGGATATWPLGLAYRVPAGDTLRVTIPGVINPNAGSYQLSVATSSDGAAKTPAYVVNPAGAVSAPQVALTSSAAGATEVRYRATFGLSSAGTLASGGTIALTAPASGATFTGATLGDYAVHDVTTGQIVALDGVNVTGGGHTVTLTLGGSVAAGDVVSVTAASVTNPTVASISNTLTVTTSADRTAVASSAFTTVAAAAVSLPSVAPSSTLPGATAVTYAVDFQTSAGGGLGGNPEPGTITLAAASGTILPGAPDDFTIADASTNHTFAATSVTLANGGATATVGVPVGVTSGDVLQLTVTNVTNPAAGTYTIGITTSSDTLAASTPAYAIVGPPVVSAISPARGPSTGGTSVTITGTNLQGVTTVDFGSTAATGVSVNGAGTQIKAISPPQPAGTVDITVTTLSGTSTTSAGDRFAYAATPAVSSLSPSSGPTGGGTTVTLSGTYLAGATTVRFGTAPATGVNVNAAGTQITATSPAGSGSVDVTVTTPLGTTGTTTADRFTYVPAPSVSGVSPASGPAAGGTSVVIAGTNLAGATGVRFGSAPATSIGVNAAGTQMTATSPPGAGTVDVTVTTAGGTSATGNADRFTYIPVPSVTAMTPSAGAISGGTAVTIAGANLTGAASVRFGSASATGVSVNAAGTQLTATSPPGSGTVDVTVTTPGGTSATTAADEFAYVGAPHVSGLYPTAGPAAGATAVTITGTNLTGATSVKFGRTAATSVSVNAQGTQLTAIAPTGTGMVDVTVTTPGGTSAATAADEFSYLLPPTVSGVAPASGPALGGAPVTITGTNLSRATAVLFGSTPAYGVSINGAGTQITAYPPGGSGTVHVSVTTPGGTSTTSTVDEFTYLPAPTVSAVAPAFGPPGGGTAVTITGTNLTGATSVRFGSVAATAVSVSDAGTQITATAPAGSGTVDVTVTTAGGTSDTSAADLYAYVATPAVSGVSPSSGPTAGATLVAITGTNLSGVTSVKFGSATATSVSVNPEGTRLTAESPAGLGTVDVTVTTPGGTSATSSADHFTYVAPPTVSALTPSSGPTGGGTLVSITGTNLSGATEVQFGAVPAHGVSVNAQGTQLTAISPYGVGTADVTVTTPGGTSATSTADQFTYVPPPTIAGINPPSGPTGGATVVTITGTNLSGATAVKFGSGAATAVSVNSAGTQVTAKAPAGTGAVDVTVTTVGGTSVTSGADQFTYLATPVVSGINPSSGPGAGDTAVTVTGTNLAGATSVKFGSAAATNVSVNAQGTQLTATSPAGRGTVDVTVTTPGGTSTTSSADQFTYVSAPTVSGLTPSSGPTAGGTSVAITGTNLSGATSVRFGSSPATSVSVNAQGTQLTATSPAGTGTLDVTVTTPGGTSATGTADRFTYVPPPTVTAISPASGSTGGGTSVTITGTSLSETTAVTFGSSAATALVVNAAGTQITATSPAGTGTVDVTVTAPGGTSATVVADQFTYVPLTAALTLDKTSGPGPLTVAATVSGNAPSGHALTYTIDFGDGSSPVSGSLPAAAISHTYTSAGSYVVQLSVTDGTSTATQTASVAVALGEPLTANAGDDQVVSVSTPVHFDGTASLPSAGIDSYHWTFGDGATADGATTDHTYTTAGTYTATLTVTEGSQTKSASATITITPAPQSTGLAVTVTDTSGSRLANADVVVITSSGQKYSATTDAGGIGHVQGLADGSYTVYGWAGGYLPATASATVANGAGQVTMALRAGQVATTSLTSKPLTKAQIIAAGIDPNDPANQNVFQFEIHLAFRGSSTVVSGYAAGGGGGGGWFPLGLGFDGSNVPCTTVCSYSWGDYTTYVSIRWYNSEPELLWLVIPGKASWLKEFFSVQMMVTNLAAPGFTLNHGVATLPLPAGLSLAPTAKPQQSTVAMPDIPGGGSATANWIVRGDTEGFYPLTASYAGLLQPFGAPISLQAATKTDLHVWGGSALQMIVDTDDHVYNGYPYLVRVGLKNVADVPVYNPAIQLLPNGRLNYIYQPQERLTQATGEVDPGQTFWTDYYRLVPEITGALDLADSFVKQTAGNVSVASTIVSHPAANPADAPAITSVALKDKIGLEWAPVSGATGYHIFSTPSPDTPFAPQPDPATMLPASDGMLKAYVPFTHGTHRWFAVSSTINGVPTMVHPLVSGDSVASAPSPTVSVSIDDKTGTSQTCGQTSVPVTFTFTDRFFGMSAYKIDGVSESTAGQWVTHGVSGETYSVTDTVKLTNGQELKVSAQGENTDSDNGPMPAWTATFDTSCPPQPAVVLAAGLTTDLAGSGSGQNDQPSASPNSLQDRPWSCDSSGQPHFQDKTDWFDRFFATNACDAQGVSRGNLISYLVSRGYDPGSDRTSANRTILEFSYNGAVASCDNGAQPTFEPKAYSSFDTVTELAELAADTWFEADSYVKQLEQYSKCWQARHGYPLTFTVIGHSEGGYEGIVMALAAWHEGYKGLISNVVTVDGAVQPWQVANDLNLGSCFAPTGIWHFPADLFSWALKDITERFLPVTLTDDAAMTAEIALVQARGTRVATTTNLDDPCLFPDATLNPIADQVQSWDINYGDGSTLHSAALQAHGNAVDTPGFPLADFLSSGWLPDATSFGSAAPAARTSAVPAVDTGGLHGTVIDPNTHQPVSAAGVSIFGPAGMQFTHAAADGSFSFSGMAPGAYALFVDPIGPDVKGAWVGGSTEADATSYTVGSGITEVGDVGGAALARLAVTLQDAQGNPVTDGKVELFNANGRPVTSALTDASGTGVLFASPGQYIVAAVAPTGRPWSSQITLTASQSITATLQPGVTVGGTLHDQTGAPLAGIVAALYSGDAVVAATQTSTDGSFSFAGVPPGDYTVKFYEVLSRFQIPPISVPVTAVAGQPASSISESAATTTTTMTSSGNSTTTSTTTTTAHTTSAPPPTTATTTSTTTPPPTPPSTATVSGTTTANFTVSTTAITTSTTAMTTASSSGGVQGIAKHVRRPLTQAQKRARAVAACSKLKNRRKREKCVAAAKRRYPITAPKKRHPARKKHRR